MSVNPLVEKVVKSVHSAGKPIGALCISPVILAKLLDKVTITMGQDSSAIQNVTAMGAIHQPTTGSEIIIDKVNKVVTSPCYMLDASIIEVADGAMNTVNALIELAGS
jgi:enhancing lycopene biosynthesis protein 2